MHLVFAVVLAPSTTRAQRVTRARPTDGDPTVSCVPAVSTAHVTMKQVRHISCKSDDHCTTKGRKTAMSSYNICDKLLPICILVIILQIYEGQKLL